MYAKQKLVVYLKKSVRGNNLSVKKYSLFQTRFHTPVVPARNMVFFCEIAHI
jgi:hypothetical protein